jgi:hypothetical protein
MEGLKRQVIDGTGLKNWFDGKKPAKSALLTPNLTPTLGQG